MKAPGLAKRGGVGAAGLVAAALVWGAWGAGAGAPEAARPAAGLVQAPRLPPATRSPVEFFLEILTAPPARREELLAGKSPESRQMIRDRVAEFERLRLPERERKLVQLRLAQFRLHLRPLLEAPPAERPVLLERAPAGDRPLLEARLQAWDALAPEVRQQVLESERTLSFFVRHESADPRRLTEALAGTPAASRAEVEIQFRHWSALTAEERGSRARNFQRFFDLTPAERARTLVRIPEPERAAMDRVLRRFAELPADQRERVMEGFGKFSGLGAVEQEEFLRNAARWRAMTPAERTAWRRLVLGVPVPPPPPLPPSVRPIPATATAT
ncbi:MAG: DUF3106 domain-containing protein, partial [Verrucomicrobiota bacterium]